MCHPFDVFATGADLALFLVRVDQDLAARQRALGCRCGGRLQVANYPRKAFGIILTGVVFALRFSFCCGACRRRTTPPSVRFFGRRRFHAPIFLLLSAVHGRLTGACLGELYDLLGVSEPHGAAVAAVVAPGVCSLGVLAPDAGRARAAPATGRGVAAGPGSALHASGERDAGGGARVSQSAHDHQLRAGCARCLRGEVPAGPGSRVT